MKTSYYDYKPRIISPYQMKEKAFDVRNNKKHPIHEEIGKVIGSFNLNITISEDSETLALFKNLNGLIAFRCELKRGNDIIGIGRGASVLSHSNRYLTKSVHIAANSSLIDAVVRATKVLDLLTGVESTVAGNAVVDTHKLREGGDEGITQKQQSYLLELIQQNISDEDERSQWESRVGGLTREEASDAIQSFKM